MEVINSLLKELGKCKKILNNIKRLIVKGVVSIIFPVDRKINRIYNSLSNSISNIKNELKEERSIMLFVLIGLFKIVGFVKKISNRNVVIIKAIILDIDENNDYIYSSTNNEYNDNIINFVNWKHVSYEDNEEKIDVGDLAYDFKNSAEDEYMFNIYFDSNNNATSNKQSNVSNNKKGKYLFVKDVIETIYNNLTGKNVELSNSIEEKKDITLGCEFYKCKFYYGEDGLVVTTVYEYKNSVWKYTCSYRLEGAHNLLELYKFSLLHKEDYYFNILSEEETKLILDSIRMYRIENTEIKLSDIIIDISKDTVALIALIGTIILLITQLKAAIPI